MDGAFPSEKGQSFDNIPGGAYGRGQRRGFRGTAENAKTKLCTRWLQGDCRFGDRCNFAHGDHELRKLPDSDAGGRFGPGGGRGGGGGRGFQAYGGRGPPGGGYNRASRPGYDDYSQGGGYGGNFNGGGGYDGGFNGGYGGGGPGPNTGYPGPAGPGGRPGPPPGMPEDVWAAQGWPVQGPNGWVMYRTRDSGEQYFHNHKTGGTQWERPADWPMDAPHM